jgi:hypothetical protein
MWPFETIVVERPILTHDQCVRALAAEIPNLPVLDAVLAVLYKQWQEWSEAAQATISDHGKLAGNVGATMALEMLRDELYRLRAEGRAGDQL